MVDGLVFSDDFGGTIGDIGVVDRDGTIMGLVFVNRRTGRRLFKKRRRLEMIRRGLVEEAWPDADGNMMYWNPNGMKQDVWLGTGDCVSVRMVNAACEDQNQQIDARVGSTEVERLGGFSAREHYKQLKEKELMVVEQSFQQRIEKYKEELSEVLDVVGYVQKKVLMKTADDDAVLSADDVRKLKLGLDACDRVLDRLIGKPKTVSEVQHSDVFSELTKLDNEWVIESDVITVEELNE